MCFLFWRVWYCSTWFFWIRGLCSLPDGRDCTWGKLGLTLMGQTMLIKSLIQCLLVGGAVCLPVSCLAWGAPVLESYRLYGKAEGYLQKHLCQHAPPRTAAATAPVPEAGHCQCRSPNGVTVPFPWVLVRTLFCLCPTSISVFTSPVEVL